MLNFIRRLFIWWEGHTIGTQFAIWRFGKKVGEDQFGNCYFENKDGSRRWVMYVGEADPTKIPAGWHSWMHHTSNECPVDVDYQPKEWEAEHTPNYTGTAKAYRPRGSMASTQDSAELEPGYSSWSPE